MRIGLIADTHLPSLVRVLDELGPGPGDALRDVDLVLHAGDVSAPSVLDWCAQYADVLVAEGNNDLFVDRRMDKKQFLDVEGWRIGMAHELRPESRPIKRILESALGGEHVDVLIGGDTHVERLEFRDEVLLVNPGSPILPHHLSTRLGSLAVLDITRERITAEIVVLGQSEGFANPCRAMRLEVESVAIRREKAALAAHFPLRSATSEI